MDRLLIVPAAGRGSRLGGDLPKALVPVAGRPMLDHLLARHAPFVDRIVVVVAPSAWELFTAFVSARSLPIDLALQREATGMLDAVIAPASLVNARQPRRVVVTWCDQIALSDATVRQLWSATTEPAPPMVLPTLEVDAPYIHFDRDSRGRIVGVRQRREGDAMPVRGETDIGLFDLSFDAYCRDLVHFASGATPGSVTGERNFLPFIPWLAATGGVQTFPGTSPIETIGINTPVDLAAIESYLAPDAPRPDQP